MIESRVPYVDIHGSKNDKENHTQGLDNSLNITEYTNKKDAVREGNLDLRTTNSSVEITKIILEVKDNAFVTANRRKILEDTTFSTNIRDLMNHLISKQEAPKPDDDGLESNENSMKGLVDASHKTIVTVISCKDDTEENDKKPNDLDMVIECHAGHPELPPSGLGSLKFRSEPEPRAVNPI